MCVNNLPKVITRQCPGAESKLRLWVTSGLQVGHITVICTRTIMNLNSGRQIISCNQHVKDNKWLLANELSRMTLYSLPTTNQ